MVRCYALGAVHSMGFWGPEKPQGQGRKEQRMRDSSKCLVRGGSKPRESCSDKGGAPWFQESPTGGALPSPTSPTPCSCGRRVCRQVAVDHPHLGGRCWSEPLPNTARPASRGRKDPS